MIGGGALALRAGGVIAATVAAAIALALLLAFLKFDQKLLDVAAARLGLVAEEVRRQSETGLALGLELAELEDLTGVLQRAAQARDVVRIDVRDERGRVLFSSGAGGAAGTPGDMSTVTVDAAGRFRSRINGDALLVGVRLRNGFGQIVGDVAVHAVLTARRDELARVRRELATSAAPVLAAALAATLLAVALTVRLTGGRVGRDGDEKTAGAPLDETAEHLHLTLETRLAAAVAAAEQELAGPSDRRAGGPPT